MQQKVSQSTSLVKITRPQPEQVLARTRLLQRLDRARNIIWVVAPPGVQAVDRFGQALLAGAGLAQEQNGHVAQVSGLHGPPAS